MSSIIIFLWVLLSAVSAIYFLQNKFSKGIVFMFISGIVAILYVVVG